jgi:Sec-independent protein translocase protein TatA
MSYILDGNREIILLLNKNLGTIIKKYGNAHTIKIFKERTAYVETSASDSGSNKDNTPKSKTNNANEASSFSAAVKNNKSSSQTRDGSKSRKNK